MQQMYQVIQVFQNGCFVAPNSVIGIDSVIGMGCIINHCTVIDHDCFIENGVHIKPNSTLGEM